MIATNSNPKKVLHVINSLGVSGGAEQQLVSNLQMFSDSRLEHHLVYLYEYDFETRLADVGSYVASSRSLFRGGEPGSRLTAIRRLDRVVSELRPDLLHCSLADASLAARLVGARRRVPVIESLVNIAHDRVRVRDNPHVKRWKLAAHRLLDFVTTRRVARFHALSTAVADSWVRSVRIDPSRIEIIPRGLDLRTLRAAASCGPTRQEVISEFQIPDDHLIILNVGRLEPQKGQRYLIEAMPAVQQAVGGVTLLIAGRVGTAASELSRLVDELELRDSVKFLGRRTDVPALMASCDVFVFPSLYEGLGVSLLEAMGLGCLVLASDIPPLNEVVTDARDGRLFAVGESGDLALLLGEVLGAAVAVPEYSSAAVERIETAFSLQDTSARLEQLYVEVLDLPTGEE